MLLVEERQARATIEALCRRRPMLSVTKAETKTPTKPRTVAIRYSPAEASHNSVDAVPVERKGAAKTLPLMPGGELPLKIARSRLKDASVLILLTVAARIARALVMKALVSAAGVVLVGKLLILISAPECPAAVYFSGPAEDVAIGEAMAGTAQKEVAR